ncbi:transcriptional repressor [Bradyrhizobium sp. BRP22]|nr:transcriptional repressor [Bradyrhizobium sp. BRP22]
MLNARLRPTQQRVLLSELCFARGDRHVSAEMLFAQARERGFPVSQSTIYKTLNQFTQAERPLPMYGPRSFPTPTPTHIRNISARRG